MTVPKHATFCSLNLVLSGHGSELDFRMAQGMARPRVPSGRGPHAISGACVSALSLALQLPGHIPNQTHPCSLDKTIWLMTSNYWKYFIIKSASEHKTTDRARDVILQATWEKIEKKWKYNFHNFESISLLFPSVSPNQAVFIIYQAHLMMVGVCGMHSVRQEPC